MNINETIKNFIEPEVLLKRLIAYSIIDAIMNDGEEYDGGVYHCNTLWNAGIALFTIDDGGGDHFHILFAANGCVIKGFGHESDLSPYNDDNNGAYPANDFYGDIPQAFYELLGDESLERDLVTFCAWQENPGGWRAAPVNVADDRSDGSADFLDYFSGRDEYVAWLGEYYDTEVDAAITNDILGGEAVTGEMVAALNSKADVYKLLEDIYDIKRAATV